MNASPTLDPLANRPAECTEIDSHAVPKAVPVSGRFVALILIGGIVLPLVCLIVDPVVFNPSGVGILREYALFAYALIAFEILAVSGWLAMYQRLGGWNAIAAGIFFVGKLFCVALGLVLLPLSIVGLLALIGILGFTPFLSAYAFFRVSERAVALTIAAGQKPGRFVAYVLVGIALAQGLPLAVWKGAQLEWESSVRSAAFGDDAQLGRLEVLAPYMSEPRISRAIELINQSIEREQTPERKRRFERLRDSLSSRLRALDD